MIELGLANASMQYSGEDQGKTPIEMAQFVPIHCPKNYVAAGGEL